VLPLLDAVPAAVGLAGLAGVVEPDAPGWLLPDDAHPATAAVQIRAAAVRASRPFLSRMARGEHGDDHSAFHDASMRNKRLMPETTQAGIRLCQREARFRSPGREPGPFGMKIVT
jgi:hypothetical protein